MTLWRRYSPQRVSPANMICYCFTAGGGLSLYIIAIFEPHSEASATMKTGLPSELAYDLVELRLVKDIGLAQSLSVHRNDQPQRTDLGKLPHYRDHKFPFPDLEVDHIVACGKGNTTKTTSSCCAPGVMVEGEGNSELVAKWIEDRAGEYR